MSNAPVKKVLLFFSKPLYSITLFKSTIVDCNSNLSRSFSKSVIDDSNENPPPESSSTVEYLTNSFGFSKKSPITLSKKIISDDFDKNPPPESPFTVEYLANSCGFSRKSAISLLSKKIKYNSNFSKVICRSFCKSVSDYFEKNPPPESSFTVEYLTNSCGFSKKSAISLSKKINLYEKNKEHCDSVLSFLKNNQFSDEHITKLIEKYPSVLCNKISVNLEPKIKFFAENGIPVLHIPEILVASPSVLGRSLDCQLKPALALLMDYVKDSEKVVVTIRRGPWLLTSDWKENERKLDYLMKVGVSKHRLHELIVLQPRCLYQSMERIVYAVDMVKNMGIRPEETRFIHLFRVTLSLSETSWKEKVKIFESLGWSKEEVKSTFARTPHCLSCSEKKLRLSMDYFVNTVKVARETIIGYPKLLMYSIEKRVIPRHTVWKILEERNLIEGNFVWVLNMSEKDFMEQYVIKHSREIPHLRKIFLSSRKDAMRLA